MSEEYRNTIHTKYNEEAKGYTVTLSGAVIADVTADQLHEDKIGRAGSLEASTELRNAFQRSYRYFGLDVLEALSGHEIKPGDNLGNNPDIQQRNANVLAHL